MIPSTAPRAINAQFARIRASQLMHWLLRRAITFFVAIPSVAYLVHNRNTVGFVLAFVVCVGLVEYWTLIDRIVQRVTPLSFEEIPVLTFHDLLQHAPSAVRRWLLGVLCGMASAVVFIDTPTTSYSSLALIGAGCLVARSSITEVTTLNR